jgi:hypothetical protein
MPVITQDFKERIETVISDNKEYIQEWDTIAEYLLADLDATGNYNYYLGFELDVFEPEGQAAIIKEIREYILMEYSRQFEFEG